MAIDPVDAAVDAVVAHLAAAFGSAATILRGWPEANVEQDLGAKPLVVVSAGPEDREACPPTAKSQSGTTTLSVVYRIAYLRIPAQIDLVCAHRAVRDTASLTLRQALDNALPGKPGLYLSSTGYFNRPVTVRAPRVLPDDDGDTASTGQWSRSWDIVIETDEVRTVTHPALVEVDVEIDDGTVTETLTVTP